jgi:hypothetical protein
MQSDEFHFALLLFSDILAKDRVNKIENILVIKQNTNRAVKSLRKNDRAK